MTEPLRCPRTRDHCECYHHLLNLVKRCCYCGLTPYQVHYLKRQTTHKASERILSHPSASGGHSIDKRRRHHEA